MNHWIRHTDLSSWKKFASVVFLILRIALLRCCLERIDGRRGHRTGITLGTLSVHLGYNHEIERHGSSSLYIHFLSQSQSLRLWLYGLSLNEARLQGSDSITIFPNFDPYNHDPGVFGERIESALALFKTLRNLS